jgi:hypothetical protein
MTKKKTMLVERDRTHYARAHGDLERVRVDEPFAIELELPTSYAQDLLAALRRVIDAGGEFHLAEIVVDLPVRLLLRPLQVKQFVAKLSEVVERSP